MAEWAAAKLTPGTYSFHVRLGQPRGTPPGTFASAEERALLISTLPEADLVRRVDGGAEIVEFIVWRPQETIGQILYYRPLLPLTPGYEDLIVEQVALRIVTGLGDPRVADFARGLGMAVEVFRPAWLEQALARRRGGS